MIKIAVLDDYQNVFQQIVDTEKYKDKFNFKIFNEPFADEKQAIVELAQMFSRMGNAIAIATARPIERINESIDWLLQHNVPFNTVMLSLGGEPSNICKQAMLQQLQSDYRSVGTLFDDSIYNIQGAQLQGVSTVHLRTNDEYWLQNPEPVYAYGL